eukprot:10594751-Lingulodinium_polyedra.AAC.1
MWNAAIEHRKQHKDFDVSALFAPLISIGIPADPSMRRSIGRHPKCLAPIFSKCDDLALRVIWPSGSS